MLKGPHGLAFLHALASLPGAKVAADRPFSASAPGRTVFWLAGMLTAGVWVRPESGVGRRLLPSAHGACSSARGFVTFSFPVPTSRRGSALLLAALIVLAAGFASPRDARALSTCTADDISANEVANCPASTVPCAINKNYTIANGCTLDFGTRTVTVKGTLDVGAGSMTLKAGSLTVASGGKIQGLGNSPPPGDHGGMITIQTTGAVVVDKAAANGIIDVSGDALAGERGRQQVRVVREHLPQDRQDRLVRQQHLPRRLDEGGRVGR